MGNTESNGNGSAEQHARAVFPATCLGEKCPNFKGSACPDSYFEWIGAKATVQEDRDMSQPPLVNEAIFVTYGQICITGEGTKGVRYRVDDYGNGHYYQEETGLLMHGDSAFGEGTDVDLFDIKVDSNGSVSEELRRTYEGWDGVKIDLT